MSLSFFVYFPSKTERSGIVYIAAVGEYELEMLFGGAHVPGCPFYVRAYDLTRIRVTDLQDGVVGQETSFKSELFYHSFS